MRRLYRPFGLRLDENVMLFRACLLLAGAVVALKVCSYARTSRWFSVSLAAPAEPPGFGFEDRVATAVSRAATIVPGVRCLTQAIVACRMLNEAGIPAVVRIGATRAGDTTIHAHAWVEHEGRIIVGGEDSPSRYCAFSDQRFGG